VFRVLCAVLLLAGCTSSEVSTPPTVAQTRVLVHLFQWPWADVGRECALLGPAGVTGVQISPPQQHISDAGKGFPWWQDYQPTGYRIESRRGNREAFATMVSDCRAAGVEIYADAVLNHRQGADPADLHTCGRSITNYQDRYEVQNCELVGLPDLATEKESVRATLAAYLNDLLDLGVAGFRIDAAKHMPAEDIQAIVGRLKKPAFIYSEVLYSAAEPIQPSEYTGFGTTLEPRYGEILAKHFRGDSFTLFADRMATLLPTGIVYVDSHDTQRGSSTLSYKDEVSYSLANMLMLAYPYGTPLLMSSFPFTAYDAGPPTAADGTTAPVSCDTFVCEHRAALPLIRFRALTAGAPVSELWSTDAAVGFARTGKGYFAVNRAATPLTRTVVTGLPAGSYRDMVSGASFTLDTSGSAAITIPATGAVALLKE
jgi:alpha-amylase